MKAVRRFIGSIISYFIMPTFDTPECWSVHEIWTHDFKDPESVRRYLEHLIYHYSAGKGVFLGPDDWYLSSAEAYKDKKSLEHEFFIGTMRLTPRLPKLSANSRYQDIPVAVRQEDCQVQADDSQVIRFIIERGMDRNQAAVGSSDSGRDAPASRIKDGEDSKKIFKGLEAKITIAFGAHPARDKISLFTTREGDYDLLGHIDFPVPSIRLPHEEDYDAILKALLVQGRFDDTHWASSSSTTLDAKNLSSFVSLPDMVCLADVISCNQNFYTASEYNCYWYSSMIFLTLRSLTSSNVTVPKGGGLGAMTIGSHEPTEIIGHKTKEAGLEPGHWGRFKIIGLPGTEKLIKIIIEWKKQRAEMNSKIRDGRLAIVRDRVQQQKMQDELRQELQKKEDELRQQQKKEDELRQEMQKKEDELRQQQKKEDELRQEMQKKEDELRQEMQKKEDELRREMQKRGDELRQEWQKMQEKTRQAMEEPLHALGLMEGYEIPQAEGVD